MAANLRRRAYHPAGPRRQPPRSAGGRERRGRPGQGQGDEQAARRSGQVADLRHQAVVDRLARVDEARPGQHGVELGRFGKRPVAKEQHHGNDSRWGWWRPAG